MHREDPYAHAIGVHNTPPGWSAGQMGDSAQWSTGSVLHDEPWLDFNGSQVGHGKWRNELVPRIISLDYARKPAKPVVITEPWYEFAEGSAPDCGADADGKPHGPCSNINALTRRNDDLAFSGDSDGKPNEAFKKWRHARGFLRSGEPRFLGLTSTPRLPSNSSRVANRWSLAPRGLNPR